MAQVANKQQKPNFEINNLPDGPKTPALIQLINWIARPLDYLEECTKKYGDIFTMRLFGLAPFVFISNPQGIKEIFSTYQIF